MICIMKVRSYYHPILTRVGKHHVTDANHIGEGHFGDDSTKPSGAATPIDAPEPPAGKRKGISKKAKTTKQRLAIIDGGGD